MHSHHQDRGHGFCLRWMEDLDSEDVSHGDHQRIRELERIEAALPHDTMAWPRDEKDRD